MTRPLLHIPREAVACVNCDAWSRYGSVSESRESPPGQTVVIRKALGLCRANPPTINPESATADNAAWPAVGGDDWCRAFRRYRGEREEAA